MKKLNMNSSWINETMGKLSIDEKIGQLLHACIFRHQFDNYNWDTFAKIKPGGMFVGWGTKNNFSNITKKVQELSSIPAIVSSDLECGAGRMIEGATSFPDMMGIAATDSEEYAYGVGKAAAVEGRAHGVHWTFAPVVDINVNPYNPITNTRGLGDDPKKISRLGITSIRGMQDHGLCACAKHFPGDGFDDRDQHIVTTINTLSMKDWYKYSGKMFKDTIDAGVWSIMIGHIALPACDPGKGTSLLDAPPATISRKLTTGLLREKLGFEGLIISDAIDMGGLTSRYSPKEYIVGSIKAGCDMILFSNLERDFKIIKTAFEEGEILEDAIDNSVRRILAVKEILGLNESLEPPKLTEDVYKSNAELSINISEKSITLIKDANKSLPLSMEKGRKVLSYHLRGDEDFGVDNIDKFLKDRGMEVIRLTKKDSYKAAPREELETYAAILIHLVFPPSYGTSRIRPAGNFNRDLWHLSGMHLKNMVFISYGSPYQSYEYPHVPLMINAYSRNDETLQAVLKVITGEIQAQGVSPVDLERPYRFKTIDWFK